MPAAADRVPFAYAVLRLVPRIDRGERINVGVVLFCRQRRGFLAVRAAVDARRIAALSPGLDATEVGEQLRALTLVAAGDPAAGPLAALEPSERFGWLVAPSSTIIQPGDVHTGVCDDPEETLGSIFAQLVS